MDWKTIFIGVLGLLFGAIGLGAVDNVYFEFGTFVVSISLISEWFITDVFKNLKKFPAMLVTWGTGIIFAYIGWFLNYGFLASVTEWYYVAAYGIGASLIANDVWPGVIKKVLEYLNLIEAEE